MTPPRERHRTDGPADEARYAVHVGLWVSAARCVLTYIVAPGLGLVGVMLGPIGLALQVLGAIRAGAGARRLWHLGHRRRWPYLGIALLVCLTAAAGLEQFAAAVVQGVR